MRSSAYVLVEQGAQPSTFLTLSRPGIEKAGVGIDPDTQRGFSL